jgi:hypothetical protein
MLLILPAINTAALHASTEKIFLNFKQTPFSLPLYSSGRKTNLVNPFTGKLNFCICSSVLVAGEYPIISILPLNSIFYANAASTAS